MPPQCPDGRIGHQPVKLALGSALVAYGLCESEWVSDPPDDERARDDVLLVAREHLRLARLIHAPAHVERYLRIDGPGKFPMQAGLGGGAQGTSETRNQHRLSLFHDHRGCAKNNCGERQRTDDGAQPSLRSHCVNQSSPPSR